MIIDQPEVDQLRKMFQLSIVLYIKPNGTQRAVMGTHSFIRYIVTVTVTSLVTTVTNEHLQ
jgi:hypothetical protein